CASKSIHTSRFCSFSILPKTEIISCFSSSMGNPEYFLLNMLDELDELDWLDGLDQLDELDGLCGLDGNALVLLDALDVEMLVMLVGPTARVYSKSLLFLAAHRGK